MAAPVASVTPSRTSGVAPLCVTFDATGTTDADVSNAFRDLFYMWNFGDTDSTWEYGANTAMSKNFATGAVPGHVYETPGTYTWTMIVWDGANADVETGTITVTDPDTVFSTTNTVVVSTGTDFTGKPTGATEVTSSDFDATIGTYVGTGKRVLFKRGDTFNASTTANISASGAISVGAWGTGAKPIVQALSSIGGVININNTAVDDLRICDLDVVGIGATDTGVTCSVGAAVDNVLFLRVTGREIGAGIVVQSGSSVTGGIVQECVIYNYYDSSGGNAIFGNWQKSALIGNTFGPADIAAEHNVRLQPAYKVTVSNNTITTPASTKMVLTIRALEHVTSADDSQYVVVTDNYLVGNRFAWTVQIAPASDLQNNHIYDVICERNWLVSGASTTTGFIVTATRATIRNNLIDLSNSASFTGVDINYTNTAGVPVPDDCRIYNNTMYSSTEDGTAYGVSIDTEPTNTVVVNNLVYAPTAVAGDMILGTGTTPGAMTNNSTDAGVTDGIKVNPQFVGPLTSPIGFTVAAASYAAGGGTAAFPSQQSDFYVGLDKSTENRIGALVQSGQAQRKNVAA